MIRKKKRYSRPKKAYEISRIKEENALLKRYALKNKLEVWKNIAQVDYFRRRAKSLAKSSLEEQNILFNKLKNISLFDISKSNWQNGLGKIVALCYTLENGRSKKSYKD